MSREVEEKTASLPRVPFGEAPPSPRLLLILRFDDGGDDLLRRWGIGGAIDDAPVFADDDNGSADTFALRFQGVIGTGNTEFFVDQEIEGEILLLDERQVTGGVGLIDPIGLGVDGSKRVDGAAHGGELIRSARGAIGRVEEERGTFFAA